MYEGFGSDKLDANECTAHDVDKPAIAVRFAAHGLGQNLLQLANYMMHTGIVSKNQLFFLAFNETGDRIRHQTHAFQNWYEDHFSLVHQRGVACDVFVSKCERAEGRCYDAYWEQPLEPGVTKRSMWKQATWYVESYKYGHLKVHNWLKTTLIRELLRLLPSTKAELDRRHQLVMDAVEAAYGSDFTRQITMHVRRTDKITGEAKLVPCTVFAEALGSVLLQEDKEKNQRVLVYLLSDDASVGEEFHLAWKAYTSQHRHHQHLPAVSVQFRYAGSRPDRTSSEQQTEEAFYHMLVDLRLMLAADAFIGSQSSNLGVVTCLLRAHQHCYTVEQPYPFAWDTAKDKPA